MINSNDLKLQRRLKVLTEQAELQKKIMERMTKGSVGHINSRGRYQATLLDIKMVKNLIEAETLK